MSLVARGFPQAFLQAIEPLSGAAGHVDAFHHGIGLRIAVPALAGAATAQAARAQAGA